MKLYTGIRFEAQVHYIALYYIVYYVVYLSNLECVVVDPST